MRLSVLFSAAAGDGGSKRDLRATLEQAGHEVVQLVEQVGVDGPDHRAELMVAAGGDGTVRRAALAVAGRGIPLAIVPIGTANNVAKSLGIEGPISSVIQKWNRARPRPLDVGVANGTGEQRFLESVGLGLIPAAIAAMHDAPKPGPEDSRSKLERALRTYRDTLAGLQPRRWRISLDGRSQDMELLALEVLNIRLIGPNLALSDDVDAADGRLSIVTVGERQREELVGYLTARIGGAESRLSLPTAKAARVELSGTGLLHVDDQVQPVPVGPITLGIESARLQYLG